MTTMIHINDPPAVPLWINGHAYLTMASAFLDVRNSLTGEVVRRTPLCDSDTTVRAVEAACAANEEWSSVPNACRTGLFVGLAEELARYSDHFRDLIVEESGKSVDEAGAEVAAVIALLGGAGVIKTPANSMSFIHGIVGNAREPLLGALMLAVPALLSGAVVVVKPDPSTPSSIFAFAELTSRCGFLPGVFNVLHGDDVVVRALHLIDGVSLLFS